MIWVAAKNLPKNVCKIRPTRKLQAGITVQHHPKELGFGWWDGGSREDYWTWNIARQLTGALSFPRNPPHFGGGDIPSYVAQPGVIMINGGTFQGKTSTLRLYIHPADAHLFKCCVKEEDTLKFLGIQDAPKFSPVAVGIDWLEGQGRDTDAQTLREYLNHG